jgi:putrescine transport system permease protein
MYFQRLQGRELAGCAADERPHMVRLIALVLGFAFLYIPILSMIVYSFNKSRLVTVWGGFSTEVVRPPVRERRRFSMPPGCRSSVAAMTATGAVVLGTLAGLALARFGRSADARCCPA